MPFPRRTGQALGVVASAAAVAVLLSGCNGGKSNTLAPASRQEHQIANLWWVMLAVATVGFGLVVVLLFLGWVRRNRAALPFGGGDRAGTLFVIGLGVAMPMVLLSALFLWSDVFVIRSTAAPTPSETKLTVDVRSRQFWWDVRYPGSRAVTANEIHIPARTGVAVIGTTGDVIHDLWVPELNRKIDLVPGRRTKLLLRADRVGTYDGRCSEFCGLQHANMLIFVYADTPARFRAWLEHNAAPARAPASDAERSGQRAFGQECGSCHAIRGTASAGQVGPDLTHFASRATIGAGAEPNTRVNLEEWIRDPQHAKPGNKMPRLALSQSEISDLVDYLESLK